MPLIGDPIVLTLGVILVALVCFIAEWFPVDLTAIAITVALMLLGLVTPEEGLSGFGNSATITVMAMFILSAGISRTGVLQIVRNLLMEWGGDTATKQIFAIGIIVGPITAFINNTAVVAVFLPIIESWCKKQNISPSKLLIPLSYSTIMGGMITLLGTSTNVLASGISKQLGYGEFSLLQFTALGILVFIVGLAYLTIVAPKLLPGRRQLQGDLLGQGYNLKDYVSEVVIAPRSSLIGQTLRSSQLQRKFDVDVLELVRDGSHFPQPLADKLLVAGDILIVRGGREDLLNIRDDRGLDILPDVKFEEEASELSSGEENIAEVLILSNSRLAGATLKEIRFRQRYNATVLAIRRGQEILRDRLGKVPLRFGDLLLVQGPRESFLGLQTTRELLVLEQRDAETLRQNKAWVAIAIVLSIIFAAAFNLVPIVVAALAGVLLMVITGCLKPGELYGSVRWDIIFLLAGLIPMGIAMDKSGATQWIAEQLLAIGGDLPGYWILTLFYIATVLLTEILSNNASIVLMLPIAVSVAESLSFNPFAFMFAVTFAASNSYMTPIGYQTNTMVYGPGGYKFLDFTRVGAPLSLVFCLLIPFLITKLYGLDVG